MEIERTVPDLCSATKGRATKPENKSRERVLCRTYILHFRLSNEKRGFKIYFDGSNIILLINAMCVSRGLPRWALVVKNPPTNAGDIRGVSCIPGLGRPPGGEHGNPLQYSCLENPMDRGSWRATVHSVTLK